MSCLLIKNMEKPNCYDCPMMKCNKCKGGQAYCVEIPLPHGRLIDADLAIANIKKQICNSCNDNVAGRCTVIGNCHTLQILEMIATSSTIIGEEKKING